MKEMTMTDVQCIESFAYRSGLVYQSVEALRPEFPRWVRYLRQHGVRQIPASPLTGDGYASSLLSLLIRQGSAVRDARFEHNLRDITGSGPTKARPPGKVPSPSTERGRILVAVPSWQCILARS
jgi:hypothetical protein